MNHDVQELKARCAGQWSEIIASLCTIDSSILDGSHHPCPRCGGTKRFNICRDGTGAAYCNDCPDGPQVASDGIATIQWLNDWTFHRTMDEIIRWLSPVPVVADNVAQLRHDVYDALGQTFGLSKKHRQDLSKRGLTDDEIDRRGYWSAPSSPAMQLSKLRKDKGWDRHAIGEKVPGVFPGGDLALSVRGALMIPVRDLAGRIIGLQCRPDYPKGTEQSKRPKYIWFSSSAHGLSPGAPAHVSMDSASRSPKKGVVRLTEGPLKGDIAETLSAEKTIAIAGVGNWKAAIDPIESIKPEFVNIAFDNDSWTKPDVARAATEVYDELQAKGYLIQFEIWPEEYKGIDDALSKGVNTTTLPIEETKKRIDQLRKVATQRPKPARLRNYKLVKSAREGKDYDQEALPIPEIAKNLLELHENWPKACRDVLFVPDKSGSVRFLKQSHELFGWIGAKLPVDFSAKCGGVGKLEVFAELHQHVDRYDETEDYPHFPPLKDHYYCKSIDPGGGEYLERFLDFFSPATEYDRELILAMIATTFWGGAPGRRVAFGIDSIAGTGAGKSELAKRIANLTGGCYSFDAKKIDEAQLRKELINGQSHRIALLDNVRESCLSNATIESLVTSAAIGGHQLHVGYTSRPNTLTWVFTMNGMSLSRDLAQRTVVIKLAEPRRTGTWDDEVDQFIAAHRMDVIADIAAFFNRPESPLDRFTRWASWERAILSRLENPAALQKLIESRAGESDEDRKTAQSVKEYFTEQLKFLGLDSDHEPIHIPVEIATAWLIKSTGKEYTKRSSRSAFKNLIDGGSLKNFGENPCKTNGRGWLWNFQNRYLEVNYELEEKLKTKKRQEEFLKSRDEKIF